MYIYIYENLKGTNPQKSFGVNEVQHFNVYSSLIKIVWCHAMSQCFQLGLSTKTRPTLENVSLHHHHFPIIA